MECGSWAFFGGALFYALVFETRGVLRKYCNSLQNYIPAPLYVPAYFVYAGAKLSAKIVASRLQQFVTPKKVETRKPRRIAQSLTSEFISTPENQKAEKVD
jgi:hypothetical protein